MHPLSLRFKDCNLEERYERRVLLGLRKFDLSMLWWPMRMLFVIRWTFSMHKVVSMTFVLGAVTLSLMPLGMYIIQYMSSEGWFLKHIKGLRLGQG